MARVATDFSAVLTAVVARLIDQITLANAATCFLTLTPDGRPLTPGDIWITVSPRGGKFDENMIEGGGRATAWADSGFTVTVHSSVELDQMERETTWLTHATLGVLETMKDAIDALTTYDLLDGSSDEILIEPIVPDGWDEPQRVGPSRGSISVSFLTKFKWSLS